MATADPFGLAGKVVMITGATGHLGSAMAAALARAGASVVATSRRLGDAQGAAGKLERVGEAAHHGVELDQMEEASVARGFEAAVAAAGRVDAVVCNAHEAMGADWRTVTGEQFDRQLRNATGYFLLARALREHLVARQAHGSVVFLGSMYGVVGSYPEVYQGVSAANPVAYQVMKGGIVQMARHLAVYWAKDGVRVNCLSPGPFPGEKAPAEVVGRLKERSPMGRMGRPEELGGPVVFLVSEASSYVTGQNLLVDGGWTAW